MPEDTNPSDEIKESADSADTQVTEPKNKSAEFESAKVDDGSQSVQAQEVTVPEWKFKRQYRRTRKAEEEAELLRKELQDYKAAYEQIKATPSATQQYDATAYYQDPLGAQKQLFREEIQTALKQHDQVSRQRQEREEYTKAAHDAAEYIRSQKDVASLKEEQELMDIIHQYDLDRISDPHIAADAALKLWRGEKGIVSKSLQKKQAVAVKGSPAAPSEGWTREKVAALAEKGGPEWQKRQNEILAAYKQGLIQ